MNLLYLDTSAWIKRYATEPGREAVEAVFAARTGLASSALGYVEAHAALARRNRRGPERGAFEQSLLDIAEDWKNFLKVRISDSIVEHGKTHAVRFGLRASDAIHLASAAALNRRRPMMYDQLVLAASDRELLAAASELGLATWNPEQGPQAV